jgi:hypothetical protein
MVSIHKNAGNAQNKCKTEIALADSLNEQYLYLNARNKFKQVFQRLKS